MWPEFGGLPYEPPVQEDKEMIKEPVKAHITSEVDIGWRDSKEFTRQMPVSWEAGMDSTTGEMKACGWDITLERNFYTGRTKIVFKNKENGLMAKSRYTESDSIIYITKIYAVHNYKIKAAKFIETVSTFTKSDIPAMLEWIREAKKEDVSEIVWEEKKKEAKTKVVELKDYIIKVA